MNKMAKWLTGAAAIALALGTTSASAQTPIKFTLDWVFQGPTSPFLVALEKGYYKAEGLNVTVDSGPGSVAGIARVAAGTYPIGSSTSIRWRASATRIRTRTSRPC